MCESVCESVRVFEYFSVSVCFSGALYFFLFPRFSFSVSLWFAAAHYRVGTPNTPVVMFKTLFLFLLSTFTLLLTRANLTVDEKAQMPKKKTCNSTEGVCPENSRNTNNASSAEASCRKELGRNSEKSVPNYNLGFRCKVTHYTREFSVFFFAWQLQNAGQSPRDHAQDLKC